MATRFARSEEHTSELQSHVNLVCRLLLEKKKKHLPHDLGSLVKAPLTSLPSPSQPTHTLRPRGCSLRPRISPPPSRLQPPPFIFKHTATTEIYTLSLPDALPI